MNSTMTRDELLAKLNSVEWNDIELKAATWKYRSTALELNAVVPLVEESGPKLIGLKVRQG